MRIETIEERYIKVKIRGRRVLNEVATKRFQGKSREKVKGRTEKKVEGG